MLVWELLFRSLRGTIREVRDCFLVGHGVRMFRIHTNGVSFRVTNKKQKQKDLTTLLPTKCKDTTHKQIHLIATFRNEYKFYNSEAGNQTERHTSSFTEEAQPETEHPK